MAETIERYGGKVRTDSRVEHILTQEKQVVGVALEGGERILAPIVISDVHPVRTLEMVDKGIFRPAFRRRIQSLPNTVGCFSVYLHFKENAVPYMNHNYYGYNTDEVWGSEQYTEQDWPRSFLYMHFCHEENPLYAKAGVVLAPMRMETLRQWQGTKVGKRGVDYQQFKHEHAERLLASLDTHFPHLSAQVAHYYASTPLTYLNYTYQDAQQ